MVKGFLDVAGIVFLIIVAKKPMKLLSAIGGGIAGAIALTVIHETARRLNEDAPRMDLLGMEAMSDTLESIDAKVPKEENLFKATMAADIVSNSLYYSVAGLGNEKQVILRGSLLGLAAGIGAVYLPKPLGLDEAPSSRTPQTRLMTVALYSIGGLVAGSVAKFIENQT